jgi:hypothetical protein
LPIQRTLNANGAKIQEVEQELNYVPATEKEWRKLVSEWRRSELTASEFCRRKLLVYQQFNQWKGKIDRIDTKYERAAQKALVRKRQLQRAASKKKTSSKAKFAQVKLTDHAAQFAAPDGSDQAQMIEIALPNGILVRLNNCSALFLSSVITALEKR